jgi:hypothetical protein
MYQFRTGLVDFIPTSAAFASSETAVGAIQNYFERIKQTASPGPIYRLVSDKAWPSRAIIPQATVATTLRALYVRF